MAPEPPAADATAATLDSRTAGGKIIRGGSLRAATYLAGVLIGAVSVPFVVRHLGVEDYGKFVTVSALVFLVGGVTEGGLGNLGVREFTTGEPQARQALMRNLLGLRLALSAVGLLVAVGFAAAAGYDGVMVAGTLIAGLSVVALTLHHTLTVPLQARLRLGWLAGLDATRQAATTVLMVVLVVIGASLLPFFAVSLAAALAVLAATIPLVRGEAPLLPAAQLRHWRRLARETVFYAAATALGILYFQVAIISMSLLSTETETGYYAAAFRIVDIANGVPWLLATTAFPLLARAARNDAERMRYALQRLLESALAVGGLFALGTLVMAPFAIEVVGGDEFESSTPVLRVLAAGMPATFLVATWAFAMLSLRLYRALIVANGLALALAIVLSVALIPPFGAIGAGVTTAVLELILAGAYGMQLARARSELRPSLRRVPGVALAAAVGAGLGLALPLHPAAATACALAAYVVVLVATRALPEEIWIALRGRAPAGQ